MLDYIQLIDRTFSDDCRRYVKTPFRWSGKDYVEELHSKLKGYQLISSKFFSVLKAMEPENKFIKYSPKVREICDGLIDCINEYLKDSPQKAYNRFDKIINDNFDNEVNFYDLSFWMNGRGNLYRAVSVDDNKKYGRDRCFHVPYNMREKVSTSRFSIPGHPTLYLSDNIQLCCEESNGSGNKLIARFHVDTSKAMFGPEMKVVDLSLQIEDLIGIINQFPNQRATLKYIIGYIMRMPIQIACSFIRANRNTPFAVEYVIPQILMQWIKEDNDKDNIVGIKYKSCYNKVCSSLGNNYAFPSSGEKRENSNFCPILADGFLMTLPYNVSDYLSTEELKKKLEQAELKKVI